MNETERIETLIAEKKLGELRTILSEMNPADVAIILGELPVEKIPLTYRILPKELAAEAFANMDSDLQELLIRSFNDVELKFVISELYMDDFVDMIEEMPANVVKRILNNASPDIRKTVNEFLKYPKDSAGSIMTTEYVDLKKNLTVEDAFRRIRMVGIDKETIYTCYVTDRNRKLQGIVTAKQLMLSESNVVLEDIMETNIISAGTLDDKEYVASLFEKYDFLALPIVDKENRLVGIVTIDDALDIISEEATEDTEKMAAITPTDKPYLKTGVFETFLKRIPWLLLLMISATFTGMIITSFETALAASVALTAFIPMLMGTGGNSGSQASVTVIRSIALGDVSLSDIFKILFKEFKVSFLCGAVLAVANFIKIYLVDMLLLNSDVTFMMALVVSLALFITVVCAKLVGSALPLLAKAVGFDPAVMASPFITTIIDAISLFVYFSIATAILNI
ncbi:MAG: magnesium transporter [Oscillospiraceae bacterium]|nr:magnesium transporter [Oscillospiraceae bacterium]